MSDIKVDHIMDASGLYCPEPVMLLHNKVRDMTEGQVLHIVATDPSTQRDIPKFCAFLGHDLLRQDGDGERFEYFIRKGAE
ncbi:sulfurtransferase TusA [Marinobacterium jannaschii]|uniref:sulfurtransferase TusA n=1 Tax=Marinobacterium jannaschii TaxID=64970 RepID=UPI000484559F|nr:sulfurtransferase TusA [Marinobacterium jannaschii]